MSYAEQHIFLTNRTLTPEQREQADSLSSHAVVGSNHAIYTYVFGGSFKGSEEELLTDIFDAMLWQDSSGSFHLRFRLPTDMISAKEVQSYVYDDDYSAIELETEESGKNIILSVRCNEEDGDSIWLEDNPEPLRELMPLREDLLSGDYRLLYLIWHQNHLYDLESEEHYETEEDRYPPVPPGLNALPGHLIDFCHRCGIDYESIGAEAAENEVQETIDYKANLKKMKKKHMRDYLKRLLNGEPDLAARLRRELEAMDS